MAGVLQGKVALVTGAASGIGRASALAFGREGARVIVSDVAADGGYQTVAAIRAAGGEAVFVAADVSVPQDAAALVRAAVETYGRLDCAHNNAGISDGGTSTHECPEETWAAVLAVNLTAVWRCMKHEIAHFLERGGSGAIVNTASVYGLGSSLSGGGPAYVASKHGVVGLTKTAAVEYAQRGIRINAVCPGPIHTGMTAGFADPERAALFVAADPMGRIGDPSEVAEAVVWLCSDAASYVTGVALPVDGGWVAR